MNRATPEPPLEPTWKALRARDAALVFVGGGLGSLVRWSLDLWLGGGQTMPATITVNIVGSFLVVFVPALLSSSVAVRTLVVPGVIGGFTTYSTFAVEVMRLFERGDFVAGAGYALALVAAGLVAAGAGWWAAGRVDALRLARREQGSTK